MKKLSLACTVVLMATALWLPVMAQKAAPEKAAPQKVDIKAKAAKYIEYMADWKFKKAAAMENMKTQEVLPAKALSKQWHGLMKTWGPYVHHSVPTLTKDRGFDVAVMKIRFQKFGMVAHVYFDQKGDIAGVRFLREDR
jgi:hypothetical protein